MMECVLPNLTYPIPQSILPSGGEGGREGRVGGRGGWVGGKEGARGEGGGRRRVGGRAGGWACSCIHLSVTLIP